MYKLSIAKRMRKLGIENACEYKIYEMHLQLNIKNV